jgi:hypothetical protein
MLHIALSLTLALLLLATGGGKLLGQASSHAIRDSLHVGAAAWRAIGALEAVIVALLLVGLAHPAVSRAGGGAVVALMVGAIVVRARAGGAQRKVGIVVDLAVLGLGAALAFAPR